jgi:hypothetical protein
MTNEQMELGFNGARLHVPATQRQHRSSRSAWWFERMRKVVDNAFDWQPAPEPRPEQIRIPGMHRQVEV